MSNLEKAKVLQKLRERFGAVRKASGSESLFVVGDEAARLYFRYSRVHEGRRTFFGLRKVDLRQLEGHNSYLCFLRDRGLEPVLVPYSDFEEVFTNSEPASDGQYKVQLLAQSGALELYIARQGRFNVESYVGLDGIEQTVEAQRLRDAADLSHSQAQTLLASIGHLKGHDVYVPECDVGRLDWDLAKQFPLRREVPQGFDRVRAILREIDVIWTKKGRNEVEALYEVEHSTPVYSGLLRFNDILLSEPKVRQFTIASNEPRRELFSRQVSRPTFRQSGLSDLCSFLQYANVVGWHSRLLKGASVDSTN